MKPTKQMAWLIDIYSQPKQKPTKKDVEKIKLNQLISKLGFFYEKFRNAVDYAEEHLIRRNSLERFLRRQILFLGEKRPKKIAKALIYEFIRANYLPNDKLPETVINEVGQTIKKYLLLLDNIKSHQLSNRKKLINWMISVAACEIDEQLIPFDQEMALVNFMYSKMIEDISFIKTKIDDKEKNLQIYIATLRTLLKADVTGQRYYLLNLYLPNWKKLNDSEIKKYSKSLGQLFEKIENHLGHSLGFQLARTIRRESVFFNVLKEVMEKNRKNLQALMNNPEKLEEKIEEVVIEKYKRTKGKLIGTIFRVIIYILFTKTILAFILELPYDYYIAKEINWGALVINVLFHPTLMFFVALTIRVPGLKNTQIIVKEIQNIVYGRERKIVFKPKAVMRRGSVSFFVFNFVYLIMFIISFGIVVLTLNFLNFNILSGILFVFFLTVVSFFGFRLRNLAKQLMVLPRKNSLLNFIVDFISLPIIRAGRFLSTNFSKVNIFLFFFDFIIETPFKMLVEFFEKAISFINDKRDEIVE